MTTVSPEKKTGTTPPQVDHKPVPVMALQFVQVGDYTTFRAEFAVTEGDIVFHFFPTPEVSALPQAERYWKETFPQALSEIAQAHYKVEFPRLKAAWTEEQGSWWMRAFGFGHLLDPHKNTYRLFDLLDARLENVMST